MHVQKPKAHDFLFLFLFFKDDNAVNCHEYKVFESLLSIKIYGRTVRDHPPTLIIHCSESIISVYSFFLHNDESH